MDSETKKESILVVLVLFFIAVLTSVVVAAFYSHANFSPVLPLIALFILVFIELIIIWRKCKNVKTMDKGKLIIATKKNNAPFLYPLIAFCVLFALLASVAIHNKVISILYLFSMIMFVVSLFTIPRAEIYEKGILYGCVFIRWDEIKEVKKNGKYLIVLAKKFKRSKIEDENGKVEEIIKKYVPDKFVNE